MEGCKLNLAVALFLSLLITFAFATASDAAETLATGAYAKATSSESYHLQSPPPRRVARALGGHGDGDDHPRRPGMTCDKYPKVCRASGSPGPDCCRKQCVDTMTDPLNCGWCGMRCWYGSRCCGGRCVGIMYDGNNCGGCGKRCKKGSYCLYGMCSYGF